MSSGTMKPGPSPEYVALLRGEITSEEYVATVKRQINDKQPLYKPSDARTQQLHLQAYLSNLGDAIGEAFSVKLGIFAALVTGGLAMWSFWDGADTTGLVLTVAGAGLLWLVLTRHRSSP